jgi:DNA-directed RNA polymerase subunit RPC12/RpoP
MLEMTCRRCGRRGRVDLRLAGRRVRCRVCGAETVAPERETIEVDTTGWLAAGVAAAEAAGAETAEFPSYALPVG